MRARASKQGHPSSLIGCLFTPDCPALQGQVLSRACWEGVRVEVVAEIPSPGRPRGRVRTLALSRGRGGEPWAREGGPLATPTGPAPPAPVPRPGAQAPPLAPSMLCGSGGGRSREAGKLCLCEREELPPPPPRRPPPSGPRRRGPRTALGETSPPLPPPPPRRAAPASSSCAKGSGGTRNGRPLPPPSAASFSSASFSAPGRSGVSAAAGSGGDSRFFGRRRLAMSCRGR